MKINGLSGPLTIIAFALAGMVLGALSSMRASVEEEVTADVVAPETTQLIEVINIDGIECRVAANPHLSFDTAEQKIRLTVACNPEILFRYLAAEEN